MYSNVFLPSIGTHNANWSFTNSETPNGFSAQDWALFYELTAWHIALRRKLQQQHQQSKTDGTPSTIKRNILSILVNDYSTTTKRDEDQNESPTEGETEPTATLTLAKTIAHYSAVWSTLEGNEIKEAVRLVLQERLSNATSNKNNTNKVDLVTKRLQFALDEIAPTSHDTTTQREDDASVTAVLFVQLVLYQYGAVQTQLTTELLLDFTTLLLMMQLKEEEPQKDAATTIKVRNLVDTIVKEWAFARSSAAQCGMLLSRLLREGSQRALQYNRTKMTKTSAENGATSRVSASLGSLVCTTILDCFTSLFESLISVDTSAQPGGENRREAAVWWAVCFPMFLSQVGYEWPWSSWSRVASKAINDKKTTRAIVDARWMDLSTSLSWRTTSSDRLVSVVPASLLPFVEDVGTDAMFSTLSFGKRPRSEEENKEGSNEPSFAVHRRGILYEATVGNTNNNNKNQLTTTTATLREEIFLRLRQKLRQSNVHMKMYGTLAERETCVGLRSQILSAIGTLPEMVQLTTQIKRAKGASSSAADSVEDSTHALERRLILAQAETLFSLLMAVTDGLLVRGYMQPLLVYVFGPMMEQLRGDWLRLGGGTDTFSSTSVELTVQSLWSHAVLALFERCDMGKSHRRLFSVRILRALTQSLYSTYSSSSTSSSTTVAEGSTASCLNVSFFVSAPSDIAELASVLAWSLHRETPEHNIRSVLRNDEDRGVGYCVKLTAEQARLVRQQEQTPSLFTTTSDVDSSSLTGTSPLSWEGLGEWLLSRDSAERQSHSFGFIVDALWRADARLREVVAVGSHSSATCTLQKDARKSLETELESWQGSSLLFL